MLAQANQQSQNSFGAHGDVTIPGEGLQHLDSFDLHLDVTRLQHIDPFKKHMPFEQ
jgi:hypothetical protein